MAQSAAAAKAISGSSPSHPTNRTDEPSRSWPASARSSSAWVPCPATTSRMPGKRRRSRGMARSSVWTPFSYSSRPV